MQMTNMAALPSLSSFHHLSIFQWLEHSSPVMLCTHCHSSLFFHISHFFGWRFFPRDLGCPEGSTYILVLTNTCHMSEWMNSNRLNILKFPFLFHWLAFKVWGPVGFFSLYFFSCHRPETVAFFCLWSRQKKEKCDMFSPSCLHWGAGSYLGPKVYVVMFLQSNL